MTDATERAVGFLDGPSGALFYSGFFAAPDPARRPGVLLVPPFGEEMNKSRHVLAAIVRDLGVRGVDVVLPDLHGTGDSAGDFGDADIDSWRADLDAVVGALLPGRAIDVVGLRFGALLAADLARRHPVRRMVLLHPVVDGKQQLVQMLRLRVASGMVAGAGRERLADLLRRLDDGDAVETAGYRLSPALAAGMQALRLDALAPRGIEGVAWIELAADRQRPLMPVSLGVVDAWTGGGIPVTTEVIACDTFWATQEIARCDGLVERVVAHLHGVER